MEDRRSGLVLARGQLAGLVTDTPDDATLLCDRLGRFVADSDDVFVNGVTIGAYRLDDVRSHIVVSEIEPRLFSGELRFELMPHGLVDDERILQVLQATSSLDVLDALEDGLSTIVEERGRGFSGGQRQRLSLARAILTNADVLILVEPTSAVDTHTEGRIAARLARDARAVTRPWSQRRARCCSRRWTRSSSWSKGRSSTTAPTTNSSHDRRSIDRSSCERTRSAAAYRQHRRPCLAYAKVLMRQHRRPLARMLSLYALAAVMSLIPAWVIGEITDFASVPPAKRTEDHRSTSGSSSSLPSRTPC